MWLDCENSGGGGGGGGVTIEYVGQFTSGSGTSAKTVNFASGTYARSDYADLTTDNFIVLPVRSSTTYSETSTSWVKGSTNDGWFATARAMTKNHEYNAATGAFKFYGGYQGEHFYRTASKGTANGTLNYKIYIVKPGISTFES